MIMLASIVIMIIIVWACGLRTAVLFIGLPILGLAFGGFIWAIASMIWSSLLSLEAFAISVAMATLAAGLITLRD